MGKRTIGRWLIPLVLLAGLGICLTHLLAQKPPSAALEQLRHTLKAPARDLTERRNTIRYWGDQLQSLGDLRKALAFQEWRDQDSDTRLAVVDAEQRALLLQRLEDSARTVLRQGAPADCLAVVNLLAEMGATLRSPRGRTGVAHDFGPDLTALVQQRPSPVREAALRALGRINADPRLAGPVFAQTLTIEDPALRTAASNALLEAMRTVVELPPPGRGTTGVDANRMEVAAAAAAYIRAAVAGLRCRDDVVRTHAIETIHLAVQALREQVKQLSPPENAEELTYFREQVVQERAELAPALVVLREQSVVLAAALSDDQADVRMHARQTLEEMARVRKLLQRRYNSLNVGQVMVQASGDSIGDDPLAQGILATVPTLLAGMADPDVRVRRTAVEFLETLEPRAPAVTAALTRALQDKDRSVRWTAARTLGKLKPPDAATAVPELSRLLTDPDIDLAKAVAIALEHLGPIAHEATPALLQAAEARDAEMRLAALRALATTAPGAPLVSQRLQVALTDEDARVRQQAAEILGQGGLVGAETLTALRGLLNDPAAEVRKAASDALANLAQQRR